MMLLVVFGVMIRLKLYLGRHFSLSSETQALCIVPDTHLALRIGWVSVYFWAMGPDRRSQTPRRKTLLQLLVSPKRAEKFTLLLAWAQGKILILFSTRPLIR